MLSLVSALSALLLAGSATAQSYQTHNLTPDGYYHNKYHAVLSMAAYGNFNATCPVQTFTEEAKLKNFPTGRNAARPPWTVINTFGPTQSGCRGFTAIVPEMNKALIIFEGDYALEQNLPQDVVSWDVLGMNTTCAGCTVNRFAAQGYLECKQATNNWQQIVGAYAGQGLVFSIAGHGLGGMHSLIASTDLNTQNIAYYSHTYGSPRVYNQAGATWYNNRFNGEAGERGIANGDMVTEMIPAGPNYAHTGTPFLYTGYNASNGGMNMQVCWNEDGPASLAACVPQPSGNTSSIQDHYFYFTNVGSCGGPNGFDRQNIATANQFIASQTSHLAEVSAASVSMAAALSTASVASVARVSASSAASVASVAAAANRAASATAVASTSVLPSAGLRTGAASSLAVVSLTALLGAGLVAALAC